MARKQPAGRLHLLSVRELLAARKGDLSDGGGLLLRVRDSSASLLLRYTATTGRRREMGLGVAHLGSAKQAGACLSAARERAQEGRDQLRRGIDPIDARDELRTTARAAQAAAKVATTRESTTLARAARDYHEREVEPVLSPKHGANWIRSLEHHVPAKIWHSPLDRSPRPSFSPRCSGSAQSKTARHEFPKPCSAFGNGWTPSLRTRCFTVTALRTRLERSDAS